MSVMARAAAAGTLLARDRRTLLLQGGGAVLAAALAGLAATTLDPLLAVSLVGGSALVLLGLRFPLLPLYVFVALVPIEETVNITGLGTLSRWSGIVFALVYGLPRLGRLVPTAMPPAGWAYVGWAVLSFTWARDPVTSQGELQTLVQLAAVGFLVADVVVHDPTVIRPLMWAYSASAAITAAIGTFGYLMGGMAQDGRVAAIANQNPAQFATLLLPALVFSLHELLEGRRVAAGGLVALLCTAGIALSGTRSVWLAVAVVLAFLLLPRLGARRAAAALVVVGILVGVTLQIPGVGALVTERTETAAATGGAGRTDIWTVGLEIVQSSPVLGVGFANFPVAFTPALVRAADVGSDVGTGRGPHNIVIGTLGELGIVGLLLLALFLGPLVLRRGWGPDGVVVQAMLASLMIDALFLDILSNRKQVWVIIGMAGGLAWLARQARGRGPRLADPPRAGPGSAPGTTA